MLDAAERFKQSGLTVAITSPVLSVAQTVQQMAKAASKTSDSRMQVLAGATSALAVKGAVDAVTKGQGTTVDGKPNQMPVLDDTGQPVMGPDGKPATRDATTAERMGGINLSISVGSSQSTTVGHAAHTVSPSGRPLPVAGFFDRTQACGYRARRHDGGPRGVAQRAVLS